jgi:single-strand DNA-binding protein
MADTATTIVGNLTADPELKFTPNGNAVVNFTLAVTARFKDGDEWVDGDTSFFRCNAWRDLAINVADSLHKGNRVVATGYLKQRSWEDKEGQTRSMIELEVQDVGPSLRWATATPIRANGSTAPKQTESKPKSAREQAEAAKQKRGAAAMNRRKRSNTTTDDPEFQEEPSF